MSSNLHFWSTTLHRKFCKWGEGMKWEWTCWKPKLSQRWTTLPLWVAVSAHWQWDPTLFCNVAIFTDWSSFHREYLFYVITQNPRYTLRYLLTNTSLHSYTKHPRIIPTIARFPLMQCNRPKHIRFASIPGSERCAHFHRIRMILQIKPPMHQASCCIVILQTLGFGVFGGLGWTHVLFILFNSQVDVWVSQCLLYYRRTTT